MVVWTITYCDNDGNVQFKYFDGLTELKKREIYHDLIINGYKVLDICDMELVKQHLKRKRNTY